MATSERITKVATATAEQIGTPRGTVGACTPEDLPALLDLYRAVYPNATAADLAANITDEDIRAWALYRDEQSEIRVAIFLARDGVTWLFARPDDCASPEVRHGSLMLAEHVYKAVAPDGVRHLVIAHAASLNRLGDSLEKEGFVSSAINVARLIHFTDLGEVARAN